MAILGLDSLTGCNSIPDFLATGTRMIFNATTAPPSWTKDTTSHNNKALRIVTGTVASGGLSPFSTVFPTTQKPVAGTTSTDGASITLNPATVAFNTGQTTVNVNSQNRTSNNNTMDTHTHNGLRYPGDAQPGPVIQPLNLASVARGLEALAINQNTASPVNAQHNHTFPGATSQHNHTTTSTAHTHNTNTAPHTHQITVAAQDFAISYYDVIIATKN